MADSYRGRMPRQAIPPEPGKANPYHELAGNMYLAIRKLLGNPGLITELDTHMQLMQLMTNYEAMGDGPMPEYAVGLNLSGNAVIGSQLHTRDGRRVGNAYVVDIEYVDDPTDTSDVSIGMPIFLCVTDAGNRLKLTVEEVDSLFYISTLVADPLEVLKRFTKLEKES